jgi:hypothetical protein
VCVFERGRKGGREREREREREGGRGREGGRENLFMYVCMQA